MKLKFITGILIFSLITIMLSACTLAGHTSQEAMPTTSSSKYGTVEVYVTDAPPDKEVKEVLITVSGMEIHRSVEEQAEEQSGGEEVPTQQQQEQTDEDKDGWIPLGISESMKTFDLIQVKGVEEFFGETQVEEGSYTQLRLSIAEVEVTTSDDVTRKANVPSSVIKIIRPFEVKAEETTSILLDFDAERSVVFTGSGEIQIKPVVKLSVNGEQSGTTEEDGEDEILEEGMVVEVACEEFNTENHLIQDIIVPVGNQLVVSLCSNASTGFAWSEAAEIGDTMILEQAKHEYSEPQPQNGEEPPPGTPGRQEWSFNTLSPGVTSVSFEYSQPWEGGEKGVWTLELMLTVE